MTGRRMRFAVRVPISNRIASPSAIVEVAQKAEDLGFYAVTVHDRLISDGRWIACGARDAEGEGDDRDVYESLIALGYLAGKTQQIRLMVSVVILPLREVISLAKQVATLDVLSDGRLILGVGVGGQPARERTQSGGVSVDQRVTNARSASASKEFVTLRVPPNRGRLADEYLQAMREIWTQPSASFAGDFVNFEEIQIFPKPAQPGGPPILVGGASFAALRRVAWHGDGWVPNLMRPEQYAAGLAELDRLAAESGRVPSYRGLNFFTSIAPTDDAALKVFRPTMGGLFKEPDLRELNLVGSPETVIARLKAYEAAGADLVELKPICRSVPDLLQMLDTIALEVMPAFETPGG